MILAVLALALQPALPPESPSGPGRHMGWHSCEDWTRARQVSRARPMEEWVWGYLTALGRHRPRLSVAAAAEMRAAIWARLDFYCAAHQQAAFGDAVSIAAEGFRRQTSRRRR